MDATSSDGFHVYLVVWTLLINAVIIWTPLVVFLTKKLGKLEIVYEFVEEFRHEKVRERLNTVEILAYQLKENINDLPARVTALDIKSRGVSDQLQDHPARVTALEVLTNRMQRDVEGFPSRTIAIELLQENMKAVQEKAMEKLDKLESEHLRMMGQCRYQQKD